MKKKSNRYVDGFVFVVPKKNIAKYRAMAKKGGQLWMKYGALEYIECQGDDIRPNMGGHKTLLFPQLVKLKPNETVWFSFIVYKSKQHRNQVNAKVMTDPWMQTDQAQKTMPFDAKRMSYGGFKVVVDLSK